jgi:intracellular multiplication protein IcmL
MAYDALEVVKLRNGFYRDRYRFIVIILFLAVFAIVVLSGVIAYMETHKPTTKYFATTNSGRLIPMVPLNDPYYKASTLLNWTANAVTSLYDYDYVNFRKVFQANQSLFTPAGWKAYLGQIRSSRNLQAVQSRKLMVQATPTGAPIIIREGVIGGRYAWKIQLPIVVTYTGLSGSFNQNLMVTAILHRMSTLTTKYGVGISQLIVAQQ